MTQKLHSITYKDNIREGHLVQLPERLVEEPRNSPSETILPHEPGNLSITPTEKPTSVLNYRVNKRKSTIPSRQLFQKQDKIEEAKLLQSFTKNTTFLFNLTQKIKENINQWRIVFWDPDDKNIPSKTHQLTSNEYLFLPDQIQHSFK